MRRIIAAPLFLLCLAGAPSAFAAPPAQTAPLELAADAPERYIVVPGDTLWGISAKYLKDPYRWPELWRMNADEVKKPQRIYPGQVLVLERGADGSPRLVTGPTVKVEPKIYVEPKTTAIPAIPYPVIQPFLARPLVENIVKLDTLPRIVAAENNRVLLGAGDRVFATGIKDRVINWYIYRPGKELKDPTTKEVLGREVVYLGNARLVAEGEPATLEITRSALEIGLGDRLMPEAKPDIISYVPHPPTRPISGNILSVYGAVGTGGRDSVVGISRGARDGLEVGHVLAIYRASRAVDERFNGVKTTYRTPEQRSGLLFIFQVFDRVSYALVMNADDPVAEGDVVRNPSSQQLINEDVGAPAPQ